MMHYDFLTVRQCLWIGSYSCPTSKRTDTFAVTAAVSLGSGGADRLGGGAAAEQLVSAGQPVSLLMGAAEDWG